MKAVLGVDVAKEKFDVELVDEQGQKKRRRVNQQKEWLQEIGQVVEATYQRASAYLYGINQYLLGGTGRVYAPSRL